MTASDKLRTARKDRLEVGQEMTLEPMRTIRGESGDTCIRPSADWADRAAPVLFVCLLVAMAAGVVSDIDEHSIALSSSARVTGLWLMFALWLLMLLLACARIAWSFFGTTRICVSSHELVAKRCLAGETISSSDPIRLSAIRDVRIDERETRFKGTVWRRWALIVQLNDGGERRLASFPNSLDANEFLRRCVR
jgi:hypothetical protein